MGAWSYVSCILCCNRVSRLEGVKEGGGKGVGRDCGISSCVNMNLTSLHA